MKSEEEIQARIDKLEKTVEELSRGAMQHSCIVSINEEIRTLKWVLA